MHPLDKKYFGAAENSLSVRYWNGVSIVTGSVVRQLGESHYLVTDGSNTRRVSLAKTTQLAQYCNGAAVPNGDYSIIDGLATIVATRAGTHFIRKITSKLAYTTEGTVDRWAINSASNGEYIITGNVVSNSSPLIMSDFQNGVYEIGGASRTLSQVWVEDTNYGLFNPAFVIPSEGIKVTAQADGQSPVISAEAFATLSRNDGIVVVMEYFSNSPGSSGFSLVCDFLDIPTYVGGWGNQVVHNNLVGRAEAYDLNGTLAQASLGVGNTTIGDYKVAFRLAPDKLSLSFDGNVVSEVTPTQPNLSPNTLGLIITVFDDPVVNLTLKKFTLYSGADYSAADLPTLSGN